jgi:poly-gamma-glutamate synthesis protein (capsule biosynthesis protein)
VRRAVIVIAIGLVVVVGALTIVELTQTRDADAPTTKRPVAVAPTDPPESRTTTTTIPPRRGNGQPVTFAFGGDVHFEGGLRSKLDADPAGMFGPIAPELTAADISMVNLETAITERGSPVAKEFTFRAPARALEALRVAGVDVVTMANNHGVDYGPVGLQDSLAAKAATPVGIVGIGANATEAYAPWKTVVRGQRISVIGASDVIDDNVVTAWTATDTQGGIASAKGANQARLLDAVRAARADSDTVVVDLHWGAEGLQCPTPRQEELAGALIEAGADIVVGSHAHRVMSAGRLGTGFVDYGLGNFAFYNESGLSGVTGVLVVTATGREIDAYAWKPARIQNNIPHLLTGSAAASDVNSFISRRACTNLTP